MKKTSQNKSQGVNAVYERFLHILKWMLIAVGIYVILNVSYKVIWHTFRLDGSLDVKDGVVQAADDELIANHRTEAAPKYFTYAKVNMPDGYTRKDSGILSDANETDFLFLANDPDNMVDQIYVAVAAGTREVSVSAAQQLYKDGFEDCDVQSITAGMLFGRQISSFTYRYSQNSVEKYGMNVYFDTTPYAVVVSLTDTEPDELEACLEGVEKWLVLTRK